MPTAVILRGSQELAPPAITAKPLRGDDATWLTVNILPSRRVRPYHHLGEALRALGRQIGCHRPRMIEPDHGAARRFRDHVVVDQRRACAWRHRHADSDEGVADHIARYRDVAQIFAPAGDDPERRRILDHIACYRRIGFDIDADPGVVVRRGADRTLRQQVADDVALHHRDAPALVEIADRDAYRRAFNGVVGDHGALKRKFGIQRHLADIADAVARDLDIGCRIAAHRGIVAIADAIAAHDHVAGAKRIDGVAVLSGAAGAGLDVLDAVVCDQRAVVADGVAQDFDAVVAGADNGVARNDEALRIERDNGCRGCRGNDVAADIAGDVFQPDAVAAAAGEFAIDNADVAAAQAMHQAAP